MILDWFRNKTPDAAYTAYTALVDQARQPAFYMITRVPDTLDGRFDMIVMHIVLVHRRLWNGGSESRAFGQHVFDIFIKDMDRSLREIGIGDVSIPKKMKKVGQSYFGRSQVYLSALDKADADELAAAIDRNLFTDESNEVASHALATYMIESEECLTKQEVGDLMSGSISWPDPDQCLKMPKHV